MRVMILVGTVCVASLILGGCGQKTSAVAPQTQASYGATESNAPIGATSAGAAYGPGAQSGGTEGRSMWAANRKHSAEENAQYQFTKNGADFGVHDEGEYVTKVHAFVERPPSDTQTIDRSNGDRLLYDPKGNVFAVVSKDGSPRTMFKPRDGAAYWAEQKDRESKRSATSTRGGGDQS